MAVDVTITRGYRNPNYFNSLNPQSGYIYYQGGSTGSPGISAHNQLQGIQGLGTAYYHLDVLQYEELAVWLSQMEMDSAHNQVESITLYGSIYFNNAGESSGGHMSNFIYWGDTGDVDTYIQEYTDDVLRVVCNDVLVMTLESDKVTMSVSTEVTADLNVTGDFSIDSSPSIGMIETTLTDSATRIPTSSAVFAAIALEDIWDRTSDGVITPATSTDPIMLFSNIYFENNVSTSHLPRYIYWGDPTDGWDTYIYESADDVLKIFAGGTEVITFAGGGITLLTGATVNTIETTLTDDNTHIPTSGAVFAYAATIAHTHRLDEVTNPNTGKTFTMSLNQLRFLWTAPVTADGALELEVTGAFTGDVLHIHQHTGAPGAGTHLVHLEAANTDVMPLYVDAAGTISAEFTKAIKTDTINEFNTDAGVTIESLKIEDGTLYTTVTDMTFQDGSVGPYTLTQLAAGGDAIWDQASNDSVSLISGGDLVMNVDTGSSYVWSIEGSPELTFDVTYFWPNTDEGISIGKAANRFLYGYFYATYADIVYVEDSTHYITTSGADMTFRDENNTTPVTLSALLGGGASYWDRDSSGFLYPSTVTDSIELDGGDIYATYGTDLGVYAGDALPGGSSAGEDAGHLVLKAGDALPGVSASSAGALYLVPGSPQAYGYSGQIFLGDAFYTSRTIALEALGVETNIAVSFKGKGTGMITLGGVNSYLYLFAATQIRMYSDTVQVGDNADADIEGYPGTSGHNTGYNLTVRGGTGYTGDNDGGNLYLYGGDPTGAGTRGDIYFGDGSNGYLSNNEAEDYVVGYNATTGLLSYMSVPSGGFGGGGSVSFGLQYEIPYTNSTVDDYDYSADFTYTGTALVLGASKYISMDEVDIRDGSTKIIYYDTVQDILRIGNTAGNDSMTGDDNILIGNNAGVLLGGGIGNTAIGLNAGSTNETASYTVAIGYQTMVNRTDGAYTVAIGYQANRYAVSGNRCTFVGGNAGRGNTVTPPTGSDNTFIGYGAGENYTTGGYNMAMGRDALNDLLGGSQNVALGASAGSAIQDGNWNMCIGGNALFDNVSGHSNTAVGYGALGNTTANNNIGIGYNAGNLIIGGTSNICIGYSAANGSTATIGGIYIGNYAGAYQDGQNNVFLGNYAGRGVSSSAGSDGDLNIAIGHQALYTLDDGQRNIAIGTEAGYDIEDGSYNLLIGYQMDVDSADDDYVFRIGYLSTVLLEGSLQTGAQWIGSEYDAKFPKLQGAVLRKTVEVLYTNVAQTAIMSMAADDMIWDIYVEVVTAFTGTTTNLLDIGISTSGNRYEDDVDISTTGWKTPSGTNVPDRRTGATSVVFQYFDGNSDAGAGQAYIHILYSNAVT